MTRTLLAVGTRNPDTFHVVGNPILAHYVTDGDWCHPGECFTTFLDEQWNTGSYELGYHRYRLDAVWEAIIEVGGWTLEWTEVHSDWFREENPEFDPHTQPCYTCGKALL